jgi:transposase
VIYLGLDVSKDWIAVGVLRPEEGVADVERIPRDEESVGRLVTRLGCPGRLWACYEAGPTGYELHRLLERLGVRCDVIAPSLIPRAPGDKIKTDRRDAKRLARLHRAGELSAIGVPWPAEEGVRDLWRARKAAVKDLTRACNRLGSFLLRHSVIWRDGRAWTIKHRQWLTGRDFDDPAVRTAYNFYLAELTVREATLEAVAAELRSWFGHDLFAGTVSRLGAYRGIDHLGALGLAAEVCDWRRFGAARSFMNFCGLVPREYSSGESVWRGKLTHAGNVNVRDQLVESAWAYRYPARLSGAIKRRQEGVDPIVAARAWKAQQRRCARWRHLAARKERQTTVAAAAARQLAGFVWAEMTS